MKSSSFLSVLFFFCLQWCYAQELKGIVLDIKTEEPLQGASVYFDNTTIGTTTNEAGEFLLEFDTSVKSSLVISFLGYEKIIVDKYQPNIFLKVKLTENVNSLNEVYLSFDDGLSREFKMRQFKRYFLGSSENANSCTIKNEDAIVLRYLKEQDQLVASAKEPLQIENKNLSYHIVYELQDFILQYENTLENQFFIPTYSFYSGTSFYQTDKKGEKIKFKKRRDEVYFGSSLHFLRSVYQDSIRENGFRLFYDKMERSVNSLMNLQVTENPKVKKVELLHSPVIVIYNNNLDDQSTIRCKSDNNYFFIDQFGNHSPVDDVIFTGHFGDQRMGDILPLDYQPLKKD